MASRVAKNPVNIPAGVDVKLDGQHLVIKGKHGQLNQVIHSLVNLLVEKDSLQVQAANEEKQSNALAGTMRALVQNMVLGVSQGFQRKLILVGVGYRAQAQGKQLNLTVGKSHPVAFTMPEGITVETPTATEILLKGADKQLVCQMAANIRAVRSPEPYKGKGIRYADEVIILKEVKKK
jgi:large subunit ribosomal protein L6